MKVGTDGVLLGAWAGMSHRPARVLDIGTGTGLIALMVAQRGAEWGCRVDAVEVDVSAAAQAVENFATSPWNGFLRVYNADVNNFVRDYGWQGGVDEGERDEAGVRCGGYDLVVSNPPFFSDSLQAPEARRNIARHGVALSYADLVRCAATAMRPSSGLLRGANESVEHFDELAQARFAVIVPFERGDELIRLAAGVGLHMCIRCDVHPIEGKPPRRSMLEFVKGEVVGELPNNASDEPPSDASDGLNVHRFVHETLTIAHSPGHYTEEYRALTRDFYLKF